MVGVKTSEIHQECKKKPVKVKRKEEGRKLKGLPGRRGVCVWGGFFLNAD